ncbi:nucleotide exchange factor SIL1 isoform X4 [Macaca mulatta]
MALQSLPSSRMAPLAILLGLLMAACFTFCLSHQNPKEFALTNPEKSSTKETERKETKAEEELDAEVLEVFYPTHEWQALRPGQAVPAGSHVRLNLQTGEREAKLQSEDKFRNNLKGKRLDINTNTYTSQDLKSALAKFKEGAEMESSKEDKARQAEVKRLFRPIEELKKDFDELNVVIETDMQIMVRLINKFNSSSSSLEEKIAALFDLEYYVHQMDNAQDLLSFGGLQVVINGLNSTEPLVKEYAAFVLGAAFSSNPKVQVEAIEGGALQKLLVILATEQPLTAKKKVCFHALPPAWPPGRLSLGLSPAPGSLSPGPVCAVLPAAPLPLCPEAVPEARGAAGSEEPGAGEGHRGAGRARGHAALRPGHGEDVRRGGG